MAFPPKKVGKSGMNPGRPNPFAKGKPVTGKKSMSGKGC